MEIVSTSADPPKPVDRSENKQPDSDPPKKQGPPKKTLWKKIKNFPFTRTPRKTKSSTIPSESEDEVIESIKSSLNNIKKKAEGFEQHVRESVRDHVAKLEGVIVSLSADDAETEKEKKEKLHDLQMDLVKLKLAIPTKEETGEVKKLSLKKLKFTTMEKEEIKNKKFLDERMPKLHGNPVFDGSMELKEFMARFDKLKDDRLKLCLLCFSVFPVGAVIKKRLMVQWWVAEGYASTEEIANENFGLLIKKGFIEPVNENGSCTVGSCRVHPFNRLALVALASRANFFRFVEGGDPTQNFSGCYQACLMGEGLISYDAFTKWNEDNKVKQSKRNEDNKVKESTKKKGDGNAEEVIKGLTGELEKLHLLMNVNEQILGFKHEWFEKMRNLNVLYLGRWKADPTHHIEVEDEEILEKGLENMRCVKLLSLQGISNIISLPHSILRVVNLSVLDLRACYILETIPENIGQYLERLTHLDMSECYLLEHMPKSLKMLKKLKVLKGFFVGKTEKERAHCSLGDLVELKELEKLCVYTNTKEFPTNEDVADLQKLKRLSKLTITWGVVELSVDEDSKNQESSSSEKAEAEADQPTSQMNSSTKEAEANKLPTSPKDSKKQESSSTAEAEANKPPTSPKDSKKQESSSNAEAEENELPTSPKDSKKQESSSNAEAKANKLPTSPKDSKKQESSSNAEAEENKLLTSPKDSKKQESSSNAEAEANKLPTSPKDSKKQESSSTEEAEAKAKAGTGKLLACLKNSKKQESFSDEETKPKAATSKLPASLKKLDLKCFPMSETPDWLKLENLKHTKLEKLYIRGGKFSDVGQYEEVNKTWEVKVLRLKYLSEIEMEWRRLQELFPKLQYLEQVECPKLTFFPCDAKGVWTNSE